jgi:arsenate reductase
MKMESNQVRIFHDPHRAVSRNTLGLIRNSGIEPTIVDYLHEPPMPDQLAELIGATGLTVRAALRANGAAYRELGLGNPQLTDGQLLAAMFANPLLIDAPFVATSRGTRLCRRPELVLEILPQLQRGFYANESGEILIAADGKLVRSRMR